MSVEETPPGGDREPREGGPSSPPSSPAPSARARGPRPDDRFVCSICLETVDDSPVVTLCGHLFCWPCLYEWLRPGMTAEERAGAFGRGTAGGYRDVYDPRPADANRRRCPVCSAPCAVGTVVPVYIQSAVEAALEEREAAAASAAGGAGRDARPAEASRTDGPDVDGGPPLGEGDGPPDPDGGDTTTPSGSPRHRADLDLADGRLLDGTLEAPVLGLRQRRGASGRPASDRLRPDDDDDDDDDDDFAAFTPVRSNGANLVDGFDAARIRSLGGDRSSADSTPVQHNRGPMGGGGAVPARPSPRVERGRDGVPPRQAPRGGERERATTTTPTSSPFRTALRPRRPRGPDGTAGPYSVPSGSRRGQGRLTSALLGMIDSFDAAGGGAGGDGSGGGSGARTAPRLHRSDGGLGGTGPERPGDGGGSGGRRDDLASAGAAQEFLSRLLLMLACFVVLCLLLF